MKLLIKSNKRGSQTIFLAMTFVSIMMCLTLMIGVIRALVVKSECMSFGNVWCKAILSEYDRHLFDDYKIMAYFGNEVEVCKKINSYIEYSANNKLGSAIEKTTSDLAGFELGNPDNFRTALEKGWEMTAIDSLRSDGRKKRTDENTSENYESRKIKNDVVLDTLPSYGVKSLDTINSLTKKIQDEGYLEKLRNLIKDTGLEMSYIKNYMGNMVTKCNNKDGYFKNEWEYIINGKCDDDVNYKVCRNYLFIVRNAMNLAYLYSDTEKKEIIIAVSECLTPGAVGVLTQAAVAELWAAIETEKDLKKLYDNDRVPFVKTDETWESDLSSLLDSSDLVERLNEEGKELLSENKDELEGKKGAEGSNGASSDGQTYDDYLTAMILLMNKDIVMLRIMDLIQINMKYRYYEDFNMMEYYVGTRFKINTNMKNYEFEDIYK